MKKIEKIALGTSVLSGIVAILSKSSAVQKTATVIAGISASVAVGGYIKSRLKKDFDEINQECDCLEQKFEEAGLTPEVVDTLSSDSLIESSDTGEGEIIYASTLLRAARENFDDEVLSVPGWKNERVLHILQDDRRFLIGIPMPRHKGGALTGIDMFQFFKEFVLEIAETKFGIDYSDIHIYQKGFEVGVRPDKESGHSVYYYDELTRNKVVNPKTKETTIEGSREYIKRVQTILSTWDNNEAVRQEWILDAKNKGEVMEGYIQFLFIDFPVYTDSRSVLAGMTVTNALILINELMSQLEIKNREGVEVPFEFDHLVFHPEDNLEDVTSWNIEGSFIETKNLIEMIG